MSKRINKLTARKVDTLKAKGLYGDGLNLWLRVTESGSKSWVFRYTRDGKTTDMGLGPIYVVSLAEAREKAAEYQKVLYAGHDPLTIKRRQQAEKRQEREGRLTFETCSNRYIDAHRAGWKNKKHAQQWENTLATYAYPIIGEVPVNEINTALIMRVLQPIWLVKNETATRLRGRIENILDWAAVQGFRAIENPARWKGHLDNLLAAPGKVQNTNHFKALPYIEIHTLMQALRSNGSLSARALEFLILTAARTGEVIGATWNEINFDERLWVIPAERMKAEREHRIPLSSRAFEIINELLVLRTHDFIFPGRSKGGCLSNAAMDKLLQQSLGFNVTVHGMRSTFRDWAAERTAYPHELCEMALSHTIRNQAEAAYRRGDMIEKRRHLMEDWLKFVDTMPTAGDVVPIGSGKRENG